jgi:hypothetical protein
MRFDANRCLPGSPSLPDLLTGLAQTAESLTIQGLPSPIWARFQDLYTDPAEPNGMALALVNRYAYGAATGQVILKAIAYHFEADLSEQYCLPGSTLRVFTLEFTDSSSWAGAGGVSQQVVGPTLRACESYLCRLAGTPGEQIWRFTSGAWYDVVGYGTQRRGERS